jgi:hypothetical protein
LAVAVIACVWGLAYSQLSAFADAVIAVLGLTRSTRLGEAVHFFAYDTPKVLLLLTGVVFVMGIVNTFFTAERTRALLAGRRLGVGNVLAATLGIVTPFCSCSAVPLFIGFLSAGVPLGVTFSILISASRSAPPSTATRHRRSAVRQRRPAQRGARPGPGATAGGKRRRDQGDASEAVARRLQQIEHLNPNQGDTK